jgi:tRNA threonylcarbamoyladenosine biosynthesis protein TsaB
LTALVIDTSLGACQVGVFEDAEMVAAASEPMQRGHQERLAPMTSEVLTKARLDLGAIGKIVVTVGPGSFTGLRVGLAFAKGLRLASDARLAGVGTLEALAAAHPDGLTAGVIDARRGAVYWQAFNGGRPLAGPEAIGLEEAAERLAAWTGPRTIVGPGAGLLAPSCGDARIMPIPAPELAALGRLAAGAPPTGDISLTYLRPAVAPALKLRALSSTDGPVVAEIHASAFEEGWAAEDILRFASADLGGLGLVAEVDGGVLAGFVVGRVIAGEAEVLTLAVRPAFRRRGLGRALLSAVLAAADAAFLEVAEDNVAAIALYRGLGFERVGRRGAYYSRRSGAADAIVMRRALNT